MNGVVTKHERECPKVISTIGLREPFCNKMGLISIYKTIRIEFNSIDPMTTNHWSVLQSTNYVLGPTCLIITHVPRETSAYIFSSITYC